MQTRREILFGGPLDGLSIHIPIHLNEYYPTEATLGLYKIEYKVRYFRDGKGNFKWDYSYRQKFK